MSIGKFLWRTTGIVFLGGCVVTYVLADLAGKTLASGTLGKLTQTRPVRERAGPAVHSRTLQAEESDSMEVRSNGTQ